MANISVDWIKKHKGSGKITMITAYDALFARLFDGIVDVILVGDSLNMSFNGEPDTLSVTLDQMIYHTKAVCNGTNSSLVVFDMPFGSYFNHKEALKNSIKVLKETKASAIKIEGGEEKRELIKSLVDNGIAIMGHIGLLPQMVRRDGGYKIKGKNQDELEKLKRDVLALQDAGVFCIVVEGVKSEIAKELTKISKVPLIGIGSGNSLDGQVLVFSDLLGLNLGHYPKFVRKYLDGAKLIQDAIKRYVEDVKSGDFPSVDESY